MLRALEINKDLAMAKKEQVDQKIKNNGRIYTPCFIGRYPKH